ncbi:MAG: addiction module protein [Rubrivivax sp.]|nr:addiction module protein [Rubrivivax sp.]
MAIPIEILESELLQLPGADRIRVLDRVVASLDADSALDAAWDAVAAQRDAEADRDPSVVLELDGVLARLRAESGKPFHPPTRI